ncbi:MAG: hypothetical protein LBD57_04385 [Endomicrobium sp.]|jgi:hypothetical protein|nr:hypothetical protein [Endomicrobium sp.]
MRFADEFCPKIEEFPSLEEMGVSEEDIKIIKMLVAYSGTPNTNSK